MSKIAAIDVALRLQLAQDNKPAPDYGRVMGMDNPPAAGDPTYGYSEADTQRFLADVADRLRLDEPPLAFSWESLDAGKCRRAALALVIRYIASATKAAEIKPAEK